MCQTHLVQAQKRLFNIGVDPCFLPVIGAFGAQADHARKVPVAGNFKTVLPDGFGQRFRDVEAVERHDRALLRLNPERFPILA
jgi:hypothetical protein